MKELLLLFGGILVVGMPALLPSMHLALAGELSMVAIAILAVLAMWVSDTVWYCVGRGLTGERRGRPAFFGAWIDRILAWRECVPELRLLFLSRFLYGTRIATNLSCGAARVPYRSVAVVNLSSSLLWIVTLFAVTYAVGSSIERVASLRFVLGALVVVGFCLPWAVRKTARLFLRHRAPGADRQDRPIRRRVSVIVPAHDEEGYLERAIRSVRAQSVPAEVVVVENGSTDRTPRIAAALADVVVSRPERLGYSRARNLGADAASGDLLVFLDADSEMGPGALREIERASRRLSIGTVLGRPSPARPAYRLFFAIKNTWQRAGLYHGVLGGLLFCDARLFERTGGFVETLPIDELHELIVRSREQGGVYGVVSRAHATTSMRRFESVGLLRSLVFWIRFRLGRESGDEYSRRCYRERRESLGSATRPPRLRPGPIVRQ